MQGKHLGLPSTRVREEMWWICGWWLHPFFPDMGLKAQLKNLHGKNWAELQRQIFFYHLQDTAQTQMSLYRMLLYILSVLLCPLWPRYSEAPVDSYTSKSPTSLLWLEHPFLPSLFDQILSILQNQAVLSLPLKAFPFSLTQVTLLHSPLSWACVFSHYKYLKTIPSNCA